MSGQAFSLFSDSLVGVSLTIVLLKALELLSATVNQLSFELCACEPCFTVQLDAEIEAFMGEFWTGQVSLCSALRTTSNFCTLETYFPLNLYLSSRTSICIDRLVNTGHAGSGSRVLSGTPLSHRF